MKQRTIEMYSSFPYIIKDYLIKKLRLCEEDEKILKALFTKDGDSEFYYDYTGIPREKFERRFKRVNDMVMTEIINLASKHLKNSK